MPKACRSDPKVGTTAVGWLTSERGLGRTWAVKLADDLHPKKGIAHFQSLNRQRNFLATTTTATTVKYSQKKKTTELCAVLNSN